MSADKGRNWSWKSSKTFKNPNRFRHQSVKLLSFWSDFKDISNLTRQFSTNMRPNEGFQPFLNFSVCLRDHCDCNLLFSGPLWLNIVFIVWNWAKGSWEKVLINNWVKKAARSPPLQETSGHLSQMSVREVLCWPRGFSAASVKEMIESVRRPNCGSLNPVTWPRLAAVEWWSRAGRLINAKWSPPLPARTPRVLQRGWGRQPETRETFTH